MAYLLSTDTLRKKIQAYTVNTRHFMVISAYRFEKRGTLLELRLDRSEIILG